MNERLPDSTEIDEMRENQINYIMDTRGCSRADAEQLLPMPNEKPQPQTLPRPAVQYANAPKRFRRPRITEESTDVYTGVIDRNQAMTNAVGAAIVRAAIRDGEQNLTPQQRAMRRAQDDRRGRRW